MDEKPIRPRDLIDDLRPIVRIYRNVDGEYGVVTNILEERHFLDHLGLAISGFLRRCPQDEDDSQFCCYHLELPRVLAAGYEILCSIRGYKAEVDTYRVVAAGANRWISGVPVGASSEPIPGIIGIGKTETADA